MQTDKTDDYVAYRLKQAEETYEAACVLYEAHYWNSVVNRLYYACFYAASALLIHHRVLTKSHAGVIGQFSQHFVRTGLIDEDSFKVYSKLLNWRNKGDYNDLFDFSKDDVTPMLSGARRFIDSVKGLAEIKPL